MGSKLNVSLINPKNQPIEIISDSTDTSHKLVITNEALSKLEEVLSCE